MPGPAAACSSPAIPGSKALGWSRGCGSSVQRVAGFALPPEGEPNLFRALGLDQHIDSTFGDVRDGGAFAAVVDRFRPDVVFHLAAQAIVRASYDDPVGTIATNALGTAHVLDALRRAPHVRAIVVVTSDKCYENRGTERAYVEDDKLGGDDPYSASKAMQELVAASFRSSYFAGGPLLATVRAGNVIGGGDWSRDRLVPDVVAALAAGRRVVLRYPGAVRPWQHVLEPLHAYLEVGARLLDGESAVASAYNVGPAREDHRTVVEVVERLARAWGASDAWETTGEAQPAEAHVLRLDASKAERELGIRPRFSLDEACRRTAQWYRAFDDGAAAGDLCADDIRAFERASAVRGGVR